MRKKCFIKDYLIIELKENNNEIISFIKFSFKYKILNIINY